MPTYTTYGGLDDRILKDGDVGFVGFNNRLRPDQLQTGFLADAQNIRLDRNGEAQVRKGTDLVLAPLATAEAVIALPFTLIADDASVTVTQTAGALVITNVTATNFVTGTQVNLSGVTDISPDPNGNRVAIRNSSSQITIQDQTYSGTAGGTATVKFNILNDSAVNAIYGSTGFSDPAAAGSQYIVIAANNKAFAVNLSTQATTQLDYPAGVSISQPVDMIQAFNKVFIFRDGETALEWDGNFSNEFTKVASGTYTQPLQITSTVTTVSGKMTVTAGSAHNLSTGDEVIVEDKAGSNLLVGERYVVTVVDSTTFTIFVQHADETNTPNVIFQQPVSVGLGFTHMPAPPFAVYHQRRLVMPFKNSVDSGADSFTSRGILDEIIASDLLDSDTYDQIFGSYRFNAGTADFVVGLHSFTDDTLMVFNRNSIHIVKNTIDLNNSTIQLLTDEVGCLARKSIQQVGNRVLFLSDNGVYGTEFLDEYNLRGTQTPLSEPINETIKRINKLHAEKAVSAYFDNRYFIAVPLDDATQNNAVLIFNFLNNQWESIDSVNDPNFHTANLIVAGEGSNRGVYSVNDIGGLHRIDARADGTDRVITQIGGAQQNLLVPASLTTRQFTYGTLERKRFKEFEIHVESSDTNTSDFDISAEVENPDSTEALGSLNSFNGGDLAVNEDVSIRGRIGGLRGYGVQYTINNTSGRPRIRAIESSASDAFRSTKKAI
jgi:hypothetical protein